MIVGPGRPKSYGPGIISASELAKNVGSDEGLLRWAYAVTRRGDNPFRARDDAASVGTAVHHALVAWLAGDALAEWMLDDCVEPEAAHAAYGAGKHWLQREIDDGWVAVSAEVPLVAESLGLGGTPDLVLGRDNGAMIRRVIDFKGRDPHTSSGKTRDTMLVPAHIAQLGAYGLLLRDAGTPCHEGVLLYLPRDGGYEASGVPVDMAAAEHIAEHLLQSVRALDHEVKRLRAYGRPVAMGESVDVEAINGDMEDETWLSGF